jgi:hypothetical protein
VDDFIARFSLCSLCLCGEIDGRGVARNANYETKLAINWEGYDGARGDSRILPNEPKVNLYGLYGQAMNTRILPNEPKVNLYGLYGQAMNTRILPNEPKVNLYEMCGLGMSMRNLPNGADRAAGAVDDGQSVEYDLVHDGVPGSSRALE